MDPMSLDAPPVAPSQRHPNPEWDWADRGTSHVEFRKYEQLPIQEVRELGHGVNGPVTEVEIKGFRVAHKKIYCRHRVTPKDLKEIEIMKKLEHEHVIQVVGYYTRGQYLGILLYPVAMCDLSTFLEDIEYLQRYQNSDSSSYLSSKPFVLDLEYHERLSRCARVCDIDIGRSLFLDSTTIMPPARAKIWQSYGCITSAIQYLHGKSIRHKDLKPHNILLSPGGLWITDFGQSTDFSDFSNSATSTGERGTIKYCAPEVAAYERSGRSADIFSLGCIFFEMAAVGSYTLDEMKSFRPLKDGSFHNNMKGVFSAFDTFAGTTPLSHLPMNLVRKMMSENPAERPDIATVNQDLNLIQAFSAIEPDTFLRTTCTTHPTSVVREPDSGLSWEGGHFITIGNTCHSVKEESIWHRRLEREQIPVVVFVDVLPNDYIDRVIFFNHCSSTAPIATVLTLPFAMSTNLWNTYTVAALLVLKPSYMWESRLASHVLLRGSEVPQSVLPLTWDLTLDSPYGSKRTVSTVLGKIVLTPPAVRPVGKE